MRERNRDKGRLEDIVFYSNNVKTILDGVSYEDFVNDIWFPICIDNGEHKAKTVSFYDK